MIERPQSSSYVFSPSEISASPGHGLGPIPASLAENASQECVKAPCIPALARAAAVNPGRPMAAEAEHDQPPAAKSAPEPSSLASAPNPLPQEVLTSGCSPAETGGAADSLSTPETGSNPPASGPAARLTEAQRHKAAWRLRVLLAAHRLAPEFFADRSEAPASASSLSLTALAKLLQVSAPTLCRLRQEYGEIPPGDLAIEKLIPRFTASGCRSSWQPFSEEPWVQTRLQQLYLLSCGAAADQTAKGRLTGSAAATLEVFAEDPRCPPELASLLRRRIQPAPLLRLIRKITDAVEQRHRGPRHAQLNATVPLRCSLVEILSDGQPASIRPGDWWVFDDMSDNLPHWWTGPEEKPLIGRQGLYAYDITRHWLGVEKLGTIRDAYTAAMILRFMRRLMQAFGKPRRGVVLEKSVWASNAIRGARLTSSGSLFDEELARDCMTDDEKLLLQKGLEGLGFIVHYTSTPRGKEIEGAFNYLQRLKPMFAAQPAEAGPITEPINIGRHAGEFEHGAKAVRRARSGSHHPRDLGFLHIDASRDLDIKVMEWINQRTSGSAGEAIENQKSKIENYPIGCSLTARDLAVFLPVTREALQLGARGHGKISASVAGEQFDFVAPELFASLHTGFRLSIKFDPSEPQLGAALFNAEPSSKNFRNWQLGEFIGFAEFLPEVPRFDWREGKDRHSQAGDLKRRYARHVRTAFGAVGLKHARAATARDGRGNVAEVNGSRLSEPQPEPKVATRKNPLATPTPEAQRNRLAERAAALRAQTVEQNRVTPDPL